MKKTLLTMLLTAATLTTFAEDSVLFSDDFQWLKPWATSGVNSNGDTAEVGETVGTDDLNANAPQLGSVFVDGVSSLQALYDKGYSIISYAKKVQEDPVKSAYLQNTYLKFGKTGAHGILILPSTGAANGDVTLSFDWCPMRQGSGKIDPLNLEVYVFEGAPSAEVLAAETTKVYQVAECGWENDHKLEWIHASIALTGATISDATRIAIGNCPEQLTASTANRWYFTNVKVTSASTASVQSITNSDAPVEYYNLQGIRVANPENGLYIVRQGNTSRKVMIK